MLDLDMYGHAELRSREDPAHGLAWFFLCEIHKEACASEGRGLGEQDGSVSGPWPSSRVRHPTELFAERGCRQNWRSHFSQGPCDMWEPNWTAQGRGWEVLRWLHGTERAPHNSEGKSANQLVVGPPRRSGSSVPWGCGSSLQTTVTINMRRSWPQGSFLFWDEGAGREMRELVEAGRVEDDVWAGVGLSRKRSKTPYCWAGIITRLCNHRLLRSRGMGYR